MSATWSRPRCVVPRPSLKDHVVARAWRPTCRPCRSTSCWPSRRCSTSSTTPRSIPPPGGRIEVEAAAPAAMGRVEIVVRDEGPGIAADGARAAVRQVLSRRRRRPAAGRHGAGARDRQGLHRGPGRHHRCAQSRGSQRRRIRGRAIRMSGPMTGDAVRILIVEDEPPIRRLLRTTLGAQDYRTIEAATGAEALTALRHHRPDLVLLDLGLPDIDGLDADREDPRGGAGADRRAVEPRRRGGQGDGARRRRRRLRHQAVRRRRADGPHPRRAAPSPAAAGRRPDLHQRRSQRRPGAPAGEARRRRT